MALAVKEASQQQHHDEHDRQDDLLTFCYPATVSGCVVRISHDELTPMVMTISASGMCNSHPSYFARVVDS